MHTALLFAGQGSQFPGMGMDFAEAYPQYRRVLEAGSDITGLDLAGLASGADEQALSQTSVAQPLIYAMSVGIFELLKDILPADYCVAGHSLGEYAALTACGVLTVEEGFKVIKHRAAAMQKAAETANGAMYAVMSGDAGLVEAVCAQTEGYVVPVNYNSCSQTVIAGEEKAALAAAETFAARGIRTSRLPVSSAFHSKLMEGAAREFKGSIAGTVFCPPRLPFYSNLDGACRDTIDAGYLAAHLVSPVRFTTQLEQMRRDGADTFIEAGPGKVLSGLVKRTLKDVRILNVSAVADLDKIRAAFESEHV